MKTNKFGKKQKQILRMLDKAGAVGCRYSKLYTAVFAEKEYSASYLTPILLRMQHQKLVSVHWERGQVWLYGKEPYDKRTDG